MLIPIDASHDVQESIRQIISEIGAISRRVASAESGGVSQRDFNDLKKTVSSIGMRPTTLDFNDVFRKSGPAHAIGYVPDPGVTAGTAKFLREDGTWVTAFLVPGTTVADDSVILTSDAVQRPFLFLLNTNADSFGPILYIRKDSASPAINDNLGAIAWVGSDSTPTAGKVFAQIQVLARAVAAGGEQGRLRILVYNNGTAVAALECFHDSVSAPLRFDTPTIAVRAYDTSATQTINTGAATAVTFNSENYDTQAFHDTSTNTSRLTVPTNYGGYYRITGRVRWSASAAAGWRQLRIEKNSDGTATVAKIVAINTVAAVTTSVVFDQEITATVALAAGDRVELFAATSENTTIATLDAAYDSPSFEMFRIGT